MQGSCRPMQRRGGANPDVAESSFFFREKAIEAGGRIGGLGSSHTTPCGAAVPARPPTRSSETTHVRCGPQWVTRATGQGTRVVVQRGYLQPKTKLLPQSKMLIISKMGKSKHRLLVSALPNSTNPISRCKFDSVCQLSRTSATCERSIRQSTRLSSGHVPAGVGGHS